MKNHVKKRCHRLTLVLMGLVAWTSLFVACKDSYPYDDKEPDWLGDNIYDYLDSKGTFTNMVRIINELDYKEVLSKTGSKTLFVADDAAFNRFYENNAWGVKRYEDLSLSQKNLLLKFAMIDNAYLIETLSNYYNGQALDEGSAIRRMTAVSLLDSIPYVKSDMLPNTTYWKDVKAKNGIYLLQDATEWPMVHLLQKSLKHHSITDNDFKVMTGIDREENDAHIFQNKVIERDIACKNGYVNVLQNVLVPPSNMASYIKTKPELSEFSNMLDRFCAPYYDRTNTINYKTYLAGRGINFTDSIYELRYFAKQGGSLVYPNSAKIDESLLLSFDPSWNSYVYQYGALQSDMGVIFAPTNKALDDYFNSSKGRALKERYGNWQAVPNDKLSLLLNRHMRESLINSIPSNFHKMVDDNSSPIGAKPSDIIDSLNYVGVNGLVYVTNNIYPPDDYVSVYGPALFSSKTTILNWAIKQYRYNLYLNSMVNSYAFIAPTNTALSHYIDPLTYGTDDPTVIKFWYDDSPAAQKVKATVYHYDKATGMKGDSITTIEEDAFIKSRLVRVLDQSIIVGDVKHDNVFTDNYYVTKDGNFVKANNIANIEGQSSSTVVNFQGGDDIVRNRHVQLSDSGIYHQDNGTTFFVDSLVQTPFQSVYKVLSDTIKYPSFSAFYDLLSGFPNNNVFLRKKNYYGIDFNVKFFNTFRYTVYVPTNDAIEDAYRKNIIPRWETVNKVTDPTVKDSLVKRLERFVRYHFQDNSVFIHPSQHVNDLYQTATIKSDSTDSYLNTYINKFYRLKVETSQDGGLDLTTEYTGDRDEQNNVKPYKVSVIKAGGLYNIMTRDYVFSLDPSSLTSYTTTTYSKSEITTSSTAVIHQINRVLRFE